MDWYPLWNSLRIAAIIPIGLPPNGSTESLPARPKINSVRAKVLPAAKRLYAALAAYVELA